MRGVSQFDIALIHLRKRGEICKTKTIGAIESELLSDN